MIYFISVILLSFSALAQQSSPVLDPNKYTVCAITINSDDEKKVFDAQVKKHPDKFNPIVELTSFGQVDWFKKSCESKIKCDQLVISGHFAGDFFSEHGDKSLSLKELEEASCSKTCDGVLKNPYEVFLFGCNTLSGREGDSRTPAQYLQVLLADGIPLARAELVVESRYGTVGDSHKASMQRIFSGEKKQIYGFDSIGPSGKNVKGFLNNYFAKTSAPKRIELLASKRIFSQVDMANKALADSLKITAFTQCPAGAADDPVTKNLCALQDKNLSIEKRLDLIHGLLAEESYLSYLPAINFFFKENPTSGYTSDQMKELALITENKVIKQQVDGLIATTKSLALKNEWSSFAQNVGFISSDEQTKIMAESIGLVFNKQMDSETSDILCNLDHKLTSKLDIKFAQIKNKKWNANELNALNCLRVKDPEIFQHAANLMKNIRDPDELAESMLFLSSYGDKDSIKVDPSILARSKITLASKDPYYQNSAIDFFVKFSPSEPMLDRVLQAKLNSNVTTNQQMAMASYAMMQTTDVKVQRQMLKIMQDGSRDTDLVNSAVFNLLVLKITDPGILKELREAQNLSSLSEAHKSYISNYLNKNETK